VIVSHLSVLTEQAAIKRVKVFAPYADMLWLETKKPDLQQAESFAAKIHTDFPNK